MSAAIGTIYQSKKLPNWLEEQFITQRSETEQVVELLVVFPDRPFLYNVVDICFTSIYLFELDPFVQFIMLDQMDGRSYLVMMLENFTSSITRLWLIRLNRKWLKSLDRTNLPQVLRFVFTGKN